MPLSSRQSSAENPGNAKFSYKKYYPVRKLICKSFAEKFNCDNNIQKVAYVLRLGDTQPALVCSVDPFIVSAYSDELDAVVMLRFPNELAEKYDLHLWSRLVTSNTYKYAHFDDTAPDIDAGPGSSGNFSDFLPIVQLFLAKHDEKIMERTKLFDEARWARVKELTDAYRNEHPNTARDGFCYFKSQKSLADILGGTHY